MAFISISVFEALSADEITREKLQKEKRLKAKPWGEGWLWGRQPPKETKACLKGQEKLRQQKRAVFSGWWAKASNATEGSNRLLRAFLDLVHWGSWGSTWSHRGTSQPA